MPMPISVCHRGASALAPENSLEAFRIAMEHRVSMSELDVYVGVDDELVVTHDPVDPDAERALPRLREVFDLVRGRMGIYVELKGERTGTALGRLLGTGAGEGVELIVGSAVLDLVAEVREAAPAVPRSILFTADWRGRVADMIMACHELGAVYAHPCFRPIDKELIDAFHADRLQVMTPHSNDADEIRAFAAMGVNVIASDDPRLVALLGWGPTSGGGRPS
jgi:glycerophosphoryl diester phosphodiesterase